MRTTMLPEGVISPEDTEFIHQAESAREVIEIIQNQLSGRRSSSADL